jgi:hypothetical protein
MPENVNPPKQPNAGKNPRRAQLHRAEFRYPVTLQLARFHAAQKAGKHPIVLLLSGGEISTWEKLLAHRAQEVGVCPMTLRRWVKRFELFGYDGLVDRVRRDKGCSRFFTRQNRAASFVINAFFEGRNPSAIHRSLAKNWPYLCSDGSRPPSLPTVRGYVRSLNSSEVRS